MWKIRKNGSALLAVFQDLALFHHPLMLYGWEIQMHVNSDFKHLSDQMDGVLDFMVREAST